MTTINAYCTRRELPALAFAHQLVESRDRTDPELLPHLHGFINYVLSRGEDKMTATKYHLMRHIERVFHHLSFDIDDASFQNFSDWARQANAICYLTDGSVRDPALLTLIDADGKGDDGAQIPYPLDAVKRKLRSEEQLRNFGVRTLSSLPPVVGDGEVECRDAQEVARRALALFLVTRRAEALGTDREISVAGLRESSPLACEALTPKEQAFLDAAVPSQQQITDFNWRYEALNVLLWSLNRITQLRPPLAPCNVEEIAKLMGGIDEKEFIGDATLRWPSDILDALDLVYRLHWAPRQSRLDGKPSGAPPYAPSIAQERHFALNWLVRFENADWDDVDTPT